MIKSAAVALLLALTMVGCAKNSGIYYWGSYESQIYALYSEPGKVPFEEQLEKLEADYQKARSLNTPVLPGYHAHVGYLYFQLGKLDQAYQSFQTEKQLFPESAIYMDRLVATLKAPK